MALEDINFQEGEDFIILLPQEENNFLEDVTFDLVCVLDTPLIDGYAY